MLDRKLPVTRMPPGDIYLRLPCRNTGPSDTVYRDCARPDLKLAVGPWIDAAKITSTR